MVGSSLGFVPCSASCREICTPGFWRDVFIETILGFLFVFLITIVGANFGGQHNVLVLGFGVSVYVIIVLEAFGHLQGAMVNPIVGLCFAFTKRLSIFKAFMYTIVEVLGSTGGALFAKWCMPEEVGKRIAAFGPVNGVDEYQLIALEAMFSLGLILTVLGSMDSDRKGVFMPSIPVGLMVGTCAMAGFNFGGGCMHPALATAYAVTANDFSNLWIFWAADFTGAAVAILLYYIAYCQSGIFSSGPVEDFDSDAKEPMNRTAKYDA